MFSFPVYVIAPIPLADIETEEQIPLAHAVALFRRRQAESFAENGPIRYRIGPMNKVELSLGLQRLTSKK